MTLRRLALISSACLCIVGCAKSPVKPEVFRSGPTVDDWSAWSNDGQSIAYHRRYPSADGPEGIYVIGRWGGATRLVTPGTFGHLQFSPDDRELIAQDFGGQLALVDVASGAARSPMYTTVGIRYPDLSPDGTKIVYIRAFALPELPRDSAGLHILDLTTGVDQSLMWNGDILEGTNSFWSPDGREIVFLQWTGVKFRVVAVASDGSRLRVITEFSQYTLLYDLRMNAGGANRPATLIFDNIAAPGGRYMVNLDGSSLARLRRRSSQWESYSPDGSEVILGEVDMTNATAVLFVRRIDDIIGSTSRQLTHWKPPIASPPVAVTNQP